jgi:hypothetical protein
MRFISTVVLASMLAGIYAAPAEPKGENNVPNETTYGTFNIYTDHWCSDGQNSVTVASGHISGLLNGTVHSVAANLPTCQCKSNSSLA